MVGELNQQQINTFLSSQVIGRIGCCRDDQVYVVPITYAHDGDYLYLHTNDGLKIQMMRENPDVCFEVDQVNNMTNWQSVIVWGIFEELEGKEAERALRFLTNRVAPLVTSETFRPTYSLQGTQYREGSKMKLVVFRIKIQRASGRFEKSQ